MRTEGKANGLVMVLERSSIRGGQVPAGAGFGFPPDQCTVLHGGSIQFAAQSHCISVGISRSPAVTCGPR